MPADISIFAAALLLVVALGFWASEGLRSGRDYFLAGRSVPWPVAGLSLAGAELSAIAVLGVPAVAFAEDWGALQFFAGAVAARLAVAAWVVPALHESGCVTPYEFLGRRLGAGARPASAALFVLARALASAARLMIAAAAASAMLGCGPETALAAIAAAGTAAVVWGGAGAAAWTGAFQLLWALGAALLTAAFLLKRADGGAAAAVHLASDAGKLALLPGGLTGLGAALLTGFFSSAAAFATDHEFCQRALAVAGPREGRRAMQLSIAASAAVLLALLAVGALLFVFYKQNPGFALPSQADQLYPHLAATVMSDWLRGLVLAAVVLASVDLPLASLSAAAVGDLLPERLGGLGAARAAAGAAALAVVALAWAFVDAGRPPWPALKAAGVSYGPLLGALAFALFGRRRARAAGAIIAGCALACAGLLALSERGLLPFGWNGLVVLGAAACYGLLRAASRPA